jgi:RES domain-containing protein
LGYGPRSGRWNLYGTPVIYACSYTSLNFLELLSIRGPVVTQSQWSLVVFEVKTEIPFVDTQDLPENWTQRPKPKSTQHLDSYWAHQRDTVALKVPSCTIPLINYPLEHNLLLNPLHSDFMKEVEVLSVEAAGFLV